MDRPIRVAFFRLDSGREPLRDWLKKLDRESRKTIGTDIKTLQFQWPIGMPLTRKMDENLWELRSQYSVWNSSSILYGLRRADCITTRIR